MGSSRSGGSRGEEGARMGEEPIGGEEEGMRGEEAMEGEEGGSAVEPKEADGLKGAASDGRSKEEEDERSG